MRKRFFLSPFLLFLSIYLPAQSWQPDAGLVHPYPARVTVSSGQNASFITDGNPHTFWQSGSPLPSGYLSQTGLNYFLRPQHYRLIPALPVKNPAFDGNTNTSINIAGGKLTLRLQPASKLLLLSLKAHVKDTLYLVLQTADHRFLRYKYTPSENFRLKNFRTETSVKIIAVKLESQTPFQLFELAALHTLPTASVLFDYGQIRNMGWISSRQLNTTSVTDIRVMASRDKQHWQPVIHLNPKAIPFLYEPLQRTVQARYLKVIFTLPLRNYQKAVLWEFDVYDRYGPYGPPPAARPSSNTFAQAFGINTIWGWGYSVYSDRLKPGTGPQKFIAVSKNVRSYERLDWDMKNPQQTPDFNKMAAGAGTPTKPWLNWDREYKVWKQDGFHIDITLAFKQDNFPDTLWKNTYREAFAFGKAYAEHFCKKEHLVSMIEIGNEPWNYNPATYRKILAGMSTGIHSAARVPVLPCAVQAFDPYNDDNSYISKYLDNTSSKEILGLNTHIYSYVFQENGKRTAVNPEDPRSAVWSMANLMRFRNKNLPGRPVYVTEFGFDSEGGGENCTHSECVSEKIQAIYGVRMAMILWRLGARQFYWYYFANVAYHSFLHNRSGLCGSYKTGFREKRSFQAFAFLQQAIGNYHFEKIIREDKKVYAYLLKNEATGKYILMAWRPTTKEHFLSKPEMLSVDRPVTKIVSILTRQTLPFNKTNENLRLHLSGVPVLIYFQ